MDEDKETPPGPLKYEQAIISMQGMADNFIAMRYSVDNYCCNSVLLILFQYLYLTYHDLSLHNNHKILN